MNASITLYTCHPKDYDPTTPSLWELNCASQLDGENCTQFRDAYKWLYGFLGIERATWCFKTKQEAELVKGESEGSVIYKLRVPSDKVIAKISKYTWHVAFSNAYWIPDEFTSLPASQWEVEVVAWERSNPDKKKLWEKHIFDEDGDSEYLIQNPILPEWIIAKL